MVQSLGVVIFMFLVGLEIDLTLLSRGRYKILSAVAVGGTIVPFVVGLLLAMALHPSHGMADFLPFALFIGASMSMTAFPVLARILHERKFYETPLGVLTMAAAAVDDVLTLGTLALVAATVASTGAWALPYIGTLSLLFALLMIVVARPALARYRDAQVGARELTLVVAAVLAAAFTTSGIGIHEIF